MYVDNVKNIRWPTSVTAQKSRESQVAKTTAQT